MNLFIALSSVPPSRSSVFAYRSSTIAPVKNAPRKGLATGALLRIAALVLLCSRDKTKKAACAFEPAATPALVHSAIDASLPESPADSPQVNRPAEKTNILHSTLVARLAVGIYAQLRCLCK
jgi:hypothetical protein